MYLGSLAATRSSQGGLRPAALGRHSFQSLVARGAARGGLRFAALVGVGFSLWLLCEAAREGLPFLSLPPFLFLFIYTNYVLRLPGCYAKQPGRTTSYQAQQAQFLVPGCSSGSPGGSTVCPAWRAQFSVPGCSCSSQGGVYVVPHSACTDFFFLLCFLFT